jgi:hypothetical protein
MIADRDSFDRNWTSLTSNLDTGICRNAERLKPFALRRRQPWGPNDHETRVICEGWGQYLSLESEQMQHTQNESTPIFLGRKQHEI